LVDPQRSLIERMLASPDVAPEALREIARQHYQTLRVEDLLREVPIVFQHRGDPRSEYEAREAHALSAEIVDEVEKLRQVVFRVLAGQDAGLQERASSPNRERLLTEADRAVFSRTISEVVSRTGVGERERLATAIDACAELPEESRRELAQMVRAGSIGDRGQLLYLSIVRSQQLSIEFATILATDAAVGEEIRHTIQASLEKVSELVEELRQRLIVGGARFLQRFLQAQPPEVVPPRESETPPSGARPVAPQKVEDQPSIYKRFESAFIELGLAAAAKLLLEVARKASEEDQRSREIREQIQRMVQRLVGEEPLALATAEGGSFAQVEYRLPPTEAQYVQALEAGKRLRRRNVG
jgi:hypothetical protein